MTLTIKKFKIPSEMIDNLKRGEEPLSADLNRAIKESDNDD